jgi:hypothetical protein
MIPGALSKTVPTSHQVSYLLPLRDEGTQRAECAATQACAAEDHCEWLLDGQWWTRSCRRTDAQARVPQQRYPATKWAVENGLELSVLRTNLLLLYKSFT